MEQMTVFWKCAGDAAAALLRLLVEGTSLWGA